MEQYEKLVFTICYQLVKDYQEAQNLTQETFLSAYRHIDSYQGDNYKPWVARIATNKAKDFLKSAYKKHVLLEYEELPTEPQEHTPTPEESYVSQETRQQLEQVIRSLPEPYHQPAVLYFIEERSVQEIAQQLDRPVKTVQTQIYRARDKLKKFIKEEM